MSLTGDFHTRGRVTEAYHCSGVSVMGYQYFILKRVIRVDISLKSQNRTYLCFSKPLISCFRSNMSLYRHLSLKSQNLELERSKLNTVRDRKYLPVEIC